MAASASALYRTIKGCLLLLAEVLVAVATGLADRADLRLHRAFVAAFAHGREPGDFALQPLLGFLELGRLAPDRRQRGALHVLRARVEAVPGHLVEHIEVAGIALDDIGVIGQLALRHASERAEVLALQRQAAMTLQGKYFGPLARDHGCGYKLALHRSPSSKRWHVAINTTGARVIPGISAVPQRIRKPPVSRG